MNSAQALTKLRKLLGPKAAYTDYRRPSSPEQRAEASAKREAARTARDTAEILLTARREALLSADADYQRLLAERTKAVALLKQADYAPHYRYTGGTRGGLFFSVAAEADTLAELIEKVEAEVKAKARA